MEQREYEEEKIRVDISDIEIVKLKSVFDRAMLFLLKSALQLIDGRTDNFIRGISLTELTLMPKLDGNYKTLVDEKRNEIKGDDKLLDPNLELALFKYGKINDFLDKQTPVRVHTILK